MTKRLWVAVLALACSGCLFTNITTPLSYASPTPGDVNGQLGPEAQGVACSTAILGLVAWGDSGYNAAVVAARATSGARLLADVKADTQYFNLLGVYQRACTRVVGFTVK